MTWGRGIIIHAKWFNSFLIYLLKDLSLSVRLMILMGICLNHLVFVTLTRMIKQ